MRTLTAIISVVILAGCSKPQVATPVLIATRDSVIETLKSPEMRAATAKGDVAYQAWAEGQISGICFVHHVKMRRKWQPVAYGLPRLGDVPTKEESDARFPFADDGFFPGGCVRTPVVEEEVHVCGQCTAAYLEWQKARERKAPSQTPEPPQRATR